MPKKQKTLKELKSIWYKKLKAAGFEDAEDTRLPEPTLKRWHGEDLRKRAKSPDTFLAKREYFLQAAQFLHWYAFKNKAERRIWELHADGASIREIAKATKTDRNMVYKIINQLKQEMLCPV